MTQHPFVATLKQYKALVWDEMQPYLNHAIPGVSSLTDQSIEQLHWKIACDYPKRGGKYFRPTLLMLIAEALGASAEQALKTAAAMEMSENWLLIHDDFEDGSVSRRGKPALHLRYSDALSINAGDTLHVIQWKILRDNASILGSEKTFRLIDEFHRMLMRTALGQSAEILQYQSAQFDQTEDDVLYIMDGKTSYYTVAGPMRLGAMVAVDDAAQLENDILPTLDTLGCQLGRAFQITDDVLDLTTDFAGLKQQMGNDIYERKRTIMLVHLLKHADEFDRKRLHTTLQKSRTEMGETDVAYILALMQEYGSIDYARTMAQQYAADAKALFDSIDFWQNEAATAHVAQAIDFIVARAH